MKDLSFNLDRSKMLTFGYVLAQKGYFEQAAFLIYGSSSSENDIVICNMTDEELTSILENKGIIKATQ